MVFFVENLKIDTTDENLQSTICKSQNYEDDPFIHERFPFQIQLSSNFAYPANICNTYMVFGACFMLMPFNPLSNNELYILEMKHMFKWFDCSLGYTDI